MPCRTWQRSTTSSSTGCPSADDAHHAGFLAYEIGASRSKNVLATAMKNLLAFATIIASFYFVGWFLYNAMPSGWLSLGLKKVGLLRIPPQVELEGLDLSEVPATPYPEGMPMTAMREIILAEEVK